ncbi:RNA helicase required for poly(A+) mRNA export [Podila epigama]|nr:RNA helicase required for poly(A+) mRNA export [Podila epigama]
MLVLDEADFMLDLQGLGQQTNQIRKFINQDVQVVMFSATWDQRVYEYAKQIMRGIYNQIRLQLKHLVVKSIKQFYIDCEDEQDRFNMLVAMYSLVSVSQSIIFVEKRETASKIGERMKAGGHSVSYLHGGMAPELRDRTMDMFRSARSKVLISTNVLARGIDVSNVNLVINYDLPKNHSSGMADFDAYIHRIGRTGRFGRTGITVNFIHSQESFELLKSIQEHYGQEVLHLPTGDPSEDISDRMDRMEAFMKKALKE